MYTSYAQAREDVLLYRALHHVHHSEGFYIDVGAYHPLLDSVTNLFYEHGWRGINIEPGRELFPAFAADRPRDINLAVAVTDCVGHVTFHQIADGQLGTLEQRFADRHESKGMNRKSYSVPATTLAEICGAHVTGPIHFLKIDVEGHEAAVLRGMNFKRYRPWILVIEATEPNDLSAPTFGEWDPIVLSEGYVFAFTDVLNRYYVAQERPDLLKAFSLPPDDYVHARLIRERDEARRERDDLQRELHSLRGAIS